MKFLNLLQSPFIRDYEYYEGVRRINIYVMRLFFALMFLFVGQSSWTQIISHKGQWEPISAVAWCTWAAYSTLSFFGIFRTLKMLPIMIFMVFYKVTWLLIVAYPLWSKNELAGSPAEGLAKVFIWVILPLVAIPWRYFFINFVLGKPIPSGK